MSKQVSELQTDIATKEEHLSAANNALKHETTALQAQKAERQKLELNVKVGSTYCG